MSSFTDMVRPESTDYKKFREDVLNHLLDINVSENGNISTLRNVMEKTFVRPEYGDDDVGSREMHAIMMKPIHNSAREMIREAVGELVDARVIAEKTNFSTVDHIAGIHTKLAASLKQAGVENDFGTATAIYDKIKEHVAKSINAGQGRG